MSIFHAEKQKEAIIFIDGQNLFKAVEECFGYTYPNYDVEALSQLVCFRNDWTLKRVHFYTGIPSIKEDSSWNNFWANKLASMGQRGIKVFKRELRYRENTIECPNGAEFIFEEKKVQCPHSGKFKFRIPKEKGIDIRLAIDVLRSVLNNESDVIIIFSQDQDLTEVVMEIKKIAASQKRWLTIISAFPVATHSTNNRGINDTDWFKLHKVDYDSCIDPRDYR